MKDRRKRLFSISKKESKQFNDNHDYIELLSCPKGGQSCAEHRKVINENMLSSRKHLVNKEYKLSIHELKTAFYKTKDLKKASCLSCAKLFRSSILNSMEMMQNDLAKMSSGIFKTKHILSHVELATQTLEELKKEGNI